MKKTNFPVYPNSIVKPVGSTVSFFYENTEDIINSRSGISMRGRYGRYHNDNWIEVEEKLASLDECEEALIFPSGMSAISSLMLCFTKAGDSIIFSQKCYRNIKNFFESHLSRHGVNIIRLDQTNKDDYYTMLRQKAGDNCQVLFIEMPSNPHLYLVDLRKLRACVGDDCLIVVDSTLSSPINLKPIRHGADLVVHSCTKYLGGHADILAGSVAGSRKLVSNLRDFRNVTGSIVSPTVAALLSRSLATLKLRVVKANVTGEKVAKYLEDHNLVKRVYHTSLRSHPDYHLGQKYLSGHGGVITFELDATEKQTSAFIDRVKLPFIGTHFGSYHAMIEQLGLFTYYKLSPEERLQLGITDSMIRLSVGLYSAEEMIDDLDKAFKYTFESPFKDAVLQETA
jgi:cystathionine gamma-synthase